MRSLPLLSLLILTTVACAQQPAPPATQPGAGKLPHINVDVEEKQVRVECQALRVDMPLEFFCVKTGTSEHESVLRSDVTPSQLHLALLMIGLEPGEPVRYSEAAQKWLPPKGPPLQIFCEYQKEGQTVRLPAYRMMRNVKSKEPMPPLTWIFAGSRVMPDGQYAADVTGYIVSIVNFDLTMIDIPKLASNANETLEWETNPETVPETGTPVTMIIEPAGNIEVPPNGAPEAEKIDMPRIEIDREGKIKLDDQAVELDELLAQLNEMQAQRPVKVQVTPADDADEELIRQVTRGLRARGIEVERRRPPVPSDPSEIKADVERMEALRQRWVAAVRPHGEALRNAAQAHYEVINSLRREQQRLIDEADRIQRTIDQLEKEYQDLTTPRPEPIDR